jgi:hypothetical protein
MRRSIAGAKVVRPRCAAGAPPSRRRQSGSTRPATRSRTTSITSTGWPLTGDPSTDRGDRQREEPGGVDTEPADHALGRSRGGLSCKLHLAVEAGQRPLSILLTAGQRGDSPQFAAVLGGIRVPRLGPGRPRTRPSRVLADKAYSARANRALLRCRGIRAVIPRRTTRPPTGAPRATRVADHRRSTGRPTSSGTRWSAGSTDSSGTGRWPLGTTSWRCAIGPRCTSLPSTNGYDF